MWESQHKVLRASVSLQCTDVWLEHCTVSLTEGEESGAVKLVVCL